MTTQERNYLVDYDIPARPGYESRRITFYHTKKKLIAEAMRQDSTIAREFEASSTHCYELGGLEEIREWPS
jgi:hypothetical protein